MTEFEWQKRMSSEQAAELLRRVADGLAGGDRVELDHEGFELKVPVADEVELEIEVEVEDGKTEVELELQWKAGGDSAGGDDQATVASSAGDERETA
jgi:amphi-Trp domain-containing protein